MKKIFVLLSVLVLPVVSFAQETTIGVFGILEKFQKLLNVIIPILISVAVAYFIYGVVSYVVAKDDGLKEKGRNAMISSIVGLSVIISVWGLVALINNTFDIKTDSSVVPDLIPGSNISAFDEAIGEN